MDDPLQALLDAGVLNTDSFPQHSRYHATPVATLERENGEPIPYLRRRFIPPQDEFAVIQQHIVVEGDRVDNLAAHYLGDPQLYWRLCDANGVMRPDMLTATTGARIAITLPKGVPGQSDE
ncbi:MAG: LysM domain-containing protein [Pseudomonadales bacterium]|nr:LysM domain-containing protein [Pseudomonadales bacterium]